MSSVAVLLLLISFNVKLARCCQTRSDCPSRLMECCDGVCEQVCSMACFSHSDCHKINSQLQCVQSMCTRTNTNHNTTVNSTVAEENCTGWLNIACSQGKICRGGVCVNVITIPSDDKEKPTSVDATRRYREHEVVTEDPSGTESQPFLSGNQEFAIALVGFSILFINFCLISLYLARKRRRRQSLERRSAGTQSSLTADDWNDHHDNTASQTISDISRMGINNFALNGELDGLQSDFEFPSVRLPPYDFSSAYHKPRPITEHETDSDDAVVDDQITNEDPPPYSDQSFQNTGRPPSYDDVLKLSTDSEEATSGL